MLPIQRAKCTVTWGNDPGRKAYESQQPPAEQAQMRDSEGAFDGQESMKPRLRALPRSCLGSMVWETHYLEDNIWFDQTELSPGKNQQTRYN